jgi:hypothetical protein
MECEQVRRAISDGDRRVLRGRKLRGHLRECSGCHDFQVAISARGADLRALAPPLPGAVAAGLLGRLLAHGVGGGHTGGLAVGSGTAIGNSAAASLTVKALAGATALTVAVAGGAHLALVNGRHGPSHSAARQGARLAPSGLAGARTPVAASHAHAPLIATSRARGGGTAAPSSTTVSVHNSLPSSARPSIEPRAGANDRPRTGYDGLSHPARGHGGTTAPAHKVLHRSPAGPTRSRRSSSSRPRHGAGPKHKQASPLPVKPKSQHDQSRGEPHKPLAAPAPGSSGSQQEAAGAHTHAHGA